MNLRSKKKFQHNILFIVIYLVFLFSFPLLRNYFNVNDIKLGAPETVLVAADSSTNFVSKVFSNFFGYFSYKKDLLNKITKLEEDLKLVKDEKIIGDITQSQDKIVAKKISSDFTKIYQTILLNKGSRDSVIDDSLVFIYPNKAVGIIESVSEKTSLVSLFSKDKNEVEGSVLLRDLNKIQDDNKNETENQIETFTSSSSIIDTISTATTSATSASSSTSSSSLSFFSNDINIDISTPINSSKSILINFVGYGGGDFVAKIPENIKISTGTLVYLARDESKVLGEIVKIEKQEAAFYQILFVRGYYNTRENSDYYIDIK